MATLVPALLEVVGKLIHLGGSAMRWLPFRKLSPPQPTPDGFPLHAQLAADLSLRVAGLEQGDDLLVPRHPPLTPQLRTGEPNSAGRIRVLAGCLYSRWGIFDRRQNQLSASLL